MAHFLVLGVAVEPHDLHAVEQRGRDRVGDVRGGEEQHVGQVEFELEVVVAERVVLRRVEHLEQCARRVAAEVGADLVDLVEQHDGVHRASLTDGADESAGQRADIGTPVPADLRLVTHAAKGNPHEVAAQCARHRLTQRRLPDARRADECQHRATAAAADDLEAALGAACSDGEVFDDALLHVVETFVVGVEHFAGGHDVGVVRRTNVPRQLEDRVEPGADPAGLRVLVAAALQLVDLAQRSLAHLLRQVRVLDARPVVLAAFRLALAELLADRSQLLAQQELALALLYAFTHVVVDLFGDLELREVGAAPLDQLLQTLIDVRCRKQPQLLVHVQVRRVTRGVGKCRRVADLLEVVDELPRAAVLQDRHGDCLVRRGQLAGVIGRPASRRPKSPVPTAPRQRRRHQRRCARDEGRAAPPRVHRSAGGRPARSWPRRRRRCTRR